MIITRENLKEEASNLNDEILNLEKKYGVNIIALACMDAAKRLYCCPACESKDVERVMLACHPPIIDLKCKKCGWRSR